MHERSRFLVDPKVQWSLLLRVLVHWAGFVVCLMAVGVLVRVLFAAGSASVGSALRDGLSSQFPILMVMFLLLPIFLRDTVKLSNRFAGPMHRLRTQLRNLATDQPASNISFRLGDYWQDVAGDFNHVRSQIDRLKSENAVLRQQVLTLQAETAQATPVRAGDPQDQAPGCDRAAHLSQPQDLSQPQNLLQPQVVIDSQVLA